MSQDGVNMIVLAAGDNVGVALRDIDAGRCARTISGHAVDALEVIPQGHKVALGDISPDMLIIRFGMPIAVATSMIPKGHLVHVHNVASRYLKNDEDHYE